MIIKRFTSESHFLPAYVVLWALVLWLDGFINFRNIEFFISENSAPLYRLTYLAFVHAPFVSTLVAFVFLLVQAFMLNNLFASKSLIDRNSYLPALFYITFMSFSFEMLGFHPVLFANFFLIIALNKIFDVYNENEVFLEVFNSGLLIGLATMFYFPAFVFFFFLLVALAVYFLINLRGVLAALFGFATPMLYIGVYYYLTDNLSEQVEIYTEGIRLLSVFSYNFPAYFYIFYSLVFLIGLSALAKLYLSYSRGKPVRIRKRFTALGYFIFFAVHSYLFVRDFPIKHFGIMAIAISPVFAVYFQEIKKRNWKEGLFTLFIIMIILEKLSGLGYVHFL